MPIVLISQLQEAETKGVRPAGYVDHYRSVATKIEDDHLWLSREDQDAIKSQYSHLPKLRDALASQGNPKPAPASLDPTLPGDALAIVVKETLGVTKWTGCGCEKTRRNMNVIGWEQCWIARDQFLAYVLDKAKANNIDPTPKQVVTIASRLWWMARKAGFKVPWPSVIAFAIRGLFPGQDIDLQQLIEPNTTE